LTVPNEYRDDRNAYRGRNNNRGGGGRGDGRGGGGERRGIPLSDLDPKTTEASRKVIGCSIEVHKGLGPGFDASVYMQALTAELDTQGVPYKCDHRIQVMYKGKSVGEVVAALFVDNLFLVHLMARSGQVSTAERMALRAQLKAAGLDLGLIVNFAERRLKDGLVRVLNIEKINLERGITASDGMMEDDDHGEGPDRVQDFDSHS
jgi:GxxExxY protein